MIVRKFVCLTIFLYILIMQGATPALASSRLTVLVGSANNTYMEMLKGIRAYLGEHENQAVIETFHLGSEADKTQKIIEDIKKDRPEIIITLGSLSLDLTTKQIDDIPIVAGMIFNKENINNHPNTTGVVLEIPIDTQFSWIKRFFPARKNVGVLYNPDQNTNIVKQATAKAQELGLNLIAQPVSSPRNLPDALKLLSGRAEILWGLSDSVVFNKKTAKNILLFSFRNKIPFIGLSNGWVKAGAYYALDRDYYDIGMQCGEIAAKILNGTKVETIEPIYPRKVIYSLNSRTAKTMKIKIEESLINKAAKVF